MNSFTVTYLVVKLVQLLVSVQSGIGHGPSSCVLPPLRIAVILPVEVENHVELIDPRTGVS